MDFRKFGMIVLAILVGEITLIIGTTIAQEVIFDGISYQNSDWNELFFGGLLTIVAACMAGYVAGLVKTGHRFTVPAILSVIVLSETIYLFFTGITTGPLWFDMLSGFGLIGGIWAGYYLASGKRLLRKSTTI